MRRVCGRSLLAVCGVLCCAVLVSVAVAPARADGLHRVVYRVWVPGQSIARPMDIFYESSSGPTQTRADVADKRSPWEHVELLNDPGQASVRGDVLMLFGTPSHGGCSIEVDGKEVARQESLLQEQAQDAYTCKPDM